MKQLLKQNSIYLGLCLTLIAALSIVLLCCEQASLHLWFNQYHSPKLDALFRYFTVIGEWVPYVVALALLFYKAGWTVFLVANIAIGGLIGQGLKYAFNTDRPITYFAEHYPEIHLQLVDGVHMSLYYSFPSGHTISFFALFFTLSIIVSEWYMEQKKTHLSLGTAFFQCLFFLFSILGAYSRIYLSQHFAVDIWGGIIFSLAFTIAIYPLFHRFSSQKWYKYHFFEKKLSKNLED